MGAIAYRSDFMQEYEKDKRTIDSFLSELDAHKQAVTQADSEQEAKSIVRVLNGVLSIPAKWKKEGYDGFSSNLRERAADAYQLKGVLERKLFRFSLAKKKRAEKESRIPEDSTINNTVEDTQETKEKPAAEPPKIITPPIRLIKPVQTKPAETKIEQYSSFSDVLKYAESKGIVGEKSLAALIWLALVAKESLGVEGGSGSGKSFVTDPFIELFLRRFRTHIY